MNYCNQPCRVVYHYTRKYTFVIVCVVLVASWILLVESDYDIFGVNVDENKFVDYDGLSAQFMNDTVEYVEEEDEGKGGFAGSWRNLTAQQIASLSELGRRMYLEEGRGRQPNNIDTNKTYKILIWKYGPKIARRMLYQYGKRQLDPFESCSVTNCELSYDDNLLPSADAILFHLHRMKGVTSLPAGSSRPPTQRWVFLTDESPYNTFLDRSGYNALRNFNGIFNWSMTYRMDSDVPVPYGRTLRLPRAERRRKVYAIDYAKKKTKMVAILGSNCGSTNKRWQYVKELQKHIAVDTYGRCGTLKCPGHFDTDCPLLDSYKFYLAFENSNCHEYVTEKLWWNAYAKEAVPIIMGESRSGIRKLLPPNSYLHTEEFSSPGDLARYIVHLNNSDEEYNRYFEWKRDFEIVNEHGYFKTPNFHYCRLCEALNYNNKTPKVYNNLEKFWSVKRDCWVLEETVMDTLLEALYS